MPAKQKAKQAKVAAKQADDKSRSKSTKKPEAPKSTPKADPKRGGSSTDNKKATSGVKKTKSDEQIVKVITKGGAAVDSLVPNKDSYRVYQNGSKIYSATLNQSNLDANNNKFYIIQILQQ